MLRFSHADICQFHGLPHCMICEDRYIRVQEVALKETASKLFARYEKSPQAMEAIAELLTGIGIPIMKTRCDA